MTSLSIVYVFYSIRKESLYWRSSNDKKIAINIGKGWLSPGGSSVLVPRPERAPHVLFFSTHRGCGVHPRALSLHPVTSSTHFRVPRLSSSLFHSPTSLRHSFSSLKLQIAPPLQGRADVGQAAAVGSAAAPRAPPMQVALPLQGHHRDAGRAAAPPRTYHRYATTVGGRELFIAAIGEGDCCHRWTWLLQRAAGSRPCCSGSRRCALLPSAEVVADSSGRCCYKGRTTLLQRGAREVGVLPSAEAPAVGGGRGCYQRRTRLLQWSGGVAANVHQRCSERRRRCSDPWPKVLPTMLLLAKAAIIRAPGGSAANLDGGASSGGAARVLLAVAGEASSRRDSPELSATTVATVGRCVSMRLCVLSLSV
jgi:hypothetical protein